MLDTITAGLALGTEVLQYINEKEAKKYLDERVKIEKELQAEYARGYEADDAKIQDLYQKAKIIIQAARDAMALRTKSS